MQTLLSLWKERPVKAEKVQKTVLGENSVLENMKDVYTTASSCSIVVFSFCRTVNN